MDFFQTFVLSLVQGLTEFLPISSSAHLILVPTLTGWSDQGLAFDVAVHAGTLVAVLFYFRKELFAMTRSLKTVVSAQPDSDAKLALFIVLATLPVSFVGLVFKDLIEDSLRTPLTIAATTIVFGILLWWGDRTGHKNRDEYSLTWKDALIIGGAQALALIPGTSRAGITITAALLLGLNRSAASRFSFLLSIPTLFAAGTLVTSDLLKTNGPVDWPGLGTGFLISGISAYLCMHFFIKLIERTGMMPYVIYRLLLGSLLLIVFL